MRSKRITAKFLGEIDAFFSDLGLRYFLVGGACLSIVRDGRLDGMTFPDNQDYDVYVLKEDEPPNLLEMLLDAGWTGRHGERSLDCAWSHVYAFKDDDMVSCQLDVNFLFRLGSYRWTPISDCYRLYDGAVFERAERVEVEGVSVSVPSPPERFLAQEYGEEWRTPWGMTWWNYPSVKLASQLGLLPELRDLSRRWEEGFEDEKLLEPPGRKV